VSALELVVAVYEQPWPLREPRGDYAPGCLVAALLKKALETLGSAAETVAATGTVAAERLEPRTGPAMLCLTAAPDTLLTASAWARHVLACWPKVVVLQKRWAPGVIVGLH